MNYICFIIYSCTRLSMLRLWKNIKLLSILLVSLLCTTLVWCWSIWDDGDEFIINVTWYSLAYKWNVDLWKVALKTDDLDEIIDLYQEIWDNVWYRDSLLIAEKYDQWLWINTFAQDNLDTLERQWLTLTDIKKTQIKLRKKSEDINAVLVDYKITEWFIEEVPMLYISQLFIPDGHNIELVSFITEDSSSHSSAVNMLKNIN